MPVESLDQLFNHELQDIYAGEQELVNALEQLAQEESNEQLQQIFEQHRKETQQHIERLEEVFNELGESPEAKGGQALGGLVEEHNSFMQAGPTDQINAAYDIGAEKKAERYEITAYENLLQMANALGSPKTRSNNSKRIALTNVSSSIGSRTSPTGSISNGSGSKGSRNAPISPPPR